MSSKGFQEMVSPRTVVFVCPHGVAKSVIASAYLNRLSVGAWAQCPWAGPEGIEPPTRGLGER